MYKTLISLLLLSLFISCNGPTSEVPQAMGSVSITINVGSTTRDLNGSDSTTAALYSDKFEVLIYNATETLSTVLDGTTTETTISVPVGTYTVLVLAGDSTSSEGILLGSGFHADVVVTENNITSTSISLTSVDHQFTMPSDVTCSENYTVTVSGNTNNSLLEVSYGGSVMENRPYVEIGSDATNVYLDCTNTGSQWSGTVDLTAPVSPESSSIHLYGSNVKLVDPTYSLDLDLKDFGSVNWKWMNNSLIPTEIESEVLRSIEFSAAGTGMNITIGWV